MSMIYNVRLYELIWYKEWLIFLLLTIGKLILCSMEEAAAKLKVLPPIVDTKDEGEYNDINLFWDIL